MTQPNVLILRAPGTNCDQETGFAFEKAGASVAYHHINQLIESPSLISDAQILCLPGGFSYGDDIAAGRILASQFQSKLSDVIHDFHSAGKLTLGICNGFQILIKTGFLLAATDEGLPATLTWNNSGRFIDRWVNLKADSSVCAFLKDSDRMYLPIAHAEGKFVPRSEAVLNELQAGHQLALTYASGNGSAEVDNFNGSTADVAGVCDPTGRIFGLMPHPERFIDRTQHPHWTRLELPEEGDGMAIFRNAVEYFA